MLLLQEATILSTHDDKRSIFNVKELNIKSDKWEIGVTLEVSDASFKNTIQLSYLTESLRNEKHT